MIIKVDDNGVVKTAIIPTKTSEIANDNYYSTLDAKSATSILANSDLNDSDWLITGTYFCPSVVIAASLSNAPAGLEDTFLLNVYNVSLNDPGSTSENSTHRLQEIMTCDGKSRWFRLCYSDSAGYWYYDDWTKSYPVEKVSNNIARIATNVDATLSNNGVTSTTYPTTFDIRDKNELILNRLEAQVYSDGRIGSAWQVRNYDTAGTEITQKSIKMTLDKSGNLTYTVDEPAKFREAIGLNDIDTVSSGGWIDLSLNSPFTALSWIPCKCKRKNGIVTVVFSFQGNSSDLHWITPVFTLPVGYRPIAEINFLIRVNNERAALMNINAYGICQYLGLLTGQSHGTTFNASGYATYIAAY